MGRTSIMRRTCISRLIYLSLAEDGEPEAVNILNGKPHFKYIVEGANLFSQPVGL
ncbi:hypothetical protein BC827DRAFT_1214970 [Russula dissimulans]|nr:hypothetical protein BC827DRAFT_1214970 [Russula dissimulans]